MPADYAAAGANYMRLPVTQGVRTATWQPPRLCCCECQKGERSTKFAAMLRSSPGGGCSWSTVGSCR